MSEFYDMESDFKIYKIRRDASEKAQEPHVHPYYEIFYLVNGECTFFLDHNIYQLNKGDLVIIPTSSIHKSTYPKLGSSERYVINFREENFKWLDKMLDKGSAKEMLPCGVISVPERRRKYVESLMEKMIFENAGPDELSNAFLKLGLCELELFLIRCANYESNVMKEIDVNNRLMQEVASYIYANYSKKITLDELSEKYSISRSYLSKKFKEITGFGFKEYLVNVRIQNACNMLLDTDMTITEIAFECGFNDSNYFGDAFRHIKGISPNKYRKQKENI